MKHLFLPALVAFAFVITPGRGQGTTPTPAASKDKAPIDVLTQAEKQHLEDAHQKALEAYPQLLQEEQRLQGEIQAMHNGASISKEKIVSEFVAHRKQLEIYMVKVDPTIQPLLDKIHAAQAQLKSATPAPASTAATPQ